MKKRLPANTSPEWLTAITRWHPENQVVKPEGPVRSYEEGGVTIQVYATGTAYGTRRRPEFNS